MTKARKDEGKPAEKDRKPKLSRETVKDLDPKEGSDDVRGGAACSMGKSTCVGAG